MSRKRATIAAFGAGAGAGAAAEFLLDPHDGRRRRHMIRDRIRSRLRRGTIEAEKRASHMADRAQGAVAEAMPGGRDPYELNDPALAAKVESEIFRPSDAPKGSVDVNAQRGVVYLRGEVASWERAAELARRASQVDGVIRVESLLHLPGEAAPHAGAQPE